jgi:transposase
VIEKYPKHLRRQVINLVKKNIRKAEVSRMLGVPYSRVQSWTSSIKSKGSNTEKITGHTLKLLRELVAKGYAFSDKSPMNRSSYKVLKKYFPVKEVKFGRDATCFIEGKEREAMQALLERRGKKSIGYQELGFMRKAFGIKSMKQNNKIMKRSRL